MATALERSQRRENQYKFFYYVDSYIGGAYAAAYYSYDDFVLEVKDNKYYDAIVLHITEDTTEDGEDPVLSEAIRQARKEGIKEFWLVDYDLNGDYKLYRNERFIDYVAVQNALITGSGLSFSIFCTRWGVTKYIGKGYIKLDRLVHNVRREEMGLSTEPAFC